MTSDPGISIIRASKSHLSHISDLEDRIFDSKERFSRARLVYLLESRNAAFFLGLKDGKPVGYGIALKNRLRNGKLKGRVYSLGVLREFRTHGIGTELLESLEKWLLNKGASFLTLETKATKSGAKDFFKKRGYQVSEFLPKYYTSLDGLRMKKSSSLNPSLRANKHRLSLRQT